MLLTLMSFHSSHAQHANCGILTAFLNDSSAKKHFFLPDYKDYPIIFIDTSYYFDDCPFKDFYQKKVSITRDPSCVYEKSLPYLIIVNLALHGRTWTLIVYQKNTGAVAQMILKKRKGERVVKKCTYSFF